MKFSTNLLSAFLLLICALPLSAQHIEMVSTGHKTSLRGLSVVSDNIIWVSGSNGAVGKSLDAGKTWEWMTVKDFEKRDFRDIEAFDARTAIIMAIAEPAIMLKTTDGGQTWKTVFTDSAKGMFLDAMEFWNVNSGIALGDPVNGKFYILRTVNAGDSWQKTPFDKLPVAEQGEACFASSGTNIRTLSPEEACFVSGGMRSHLFINDQRIDLPLVQGKETTGANSIAVWDNNQLKNGLHLVIVGGDFNRDTSNYKNASVSKDGGKTWEQMITPPHGYRSCIEYLTEDKLITCGTSGIDVSTDGGINWQLISGESFHACRKAKNGSAVFLSGGNGKIAKLVW